jgi:hypothetical protein
MIETTKLEMEDGGRVASNAGLDTYQNQTVHPFIEPLSHQEIGEMIKNGFEEAKLIQKACHFAMYGRKC